MTRTDGRRAARAPRFDVLEVRTLLDADPLGLSSPKRLDPARSLIVGFADLAPAARTRATLRALGAQVLQTLPDGSAVVALRAGSNRAAALDRLRRDPKVRYAEPNTEIRAAAIVPNDPSFASQYGLNNSNDVDIDAPQAWGASTGAGTIVAVLDTGIDTTHPDLASQLWVNTGEIPGNRIDDDRDGYIDDVNGWNFDSNTNNIQDDNGHGSHVSGIVAAAGNNGLGVIGVAWNARILPLKVLDSQGSGSNDAAVAAIYYAVAHGARVINASWGGAGYSQSLANAILYAGAQGVVFVTAAGNEAANNNVTRTYPANYRYANLLSVAAVDASGSLARFSNYGSTTVDAAGPGVNVLSTVPGGYASYSGTSMATPHVAGVVALLVAQHPESSAAQLVQRILATTKPLASLAGRTVTGGLVDAATALGVVGGTDFGMRGGPDSTPAPAPPDPPAASAPAESPAGDDTVRSIILASDEYFAAHGGTATGFVVGLYTDLLGRTPDAFGLPVWLGQLQAGVSRLAVVQAIQASTEALRTKVALWYREDLGRPEALEPLKADPGVLTWAGALAAGAGDDAVRGVILGSEEFYARTGGTAQGFVSSLYSSLLGRVPDELGLQNWLGRLQAGASRLSVVQAIQASIEGHLTKAARWYRDDLRRPGSLEQLKADPGVATWAGLLATS